jgi:hypothetical protein
MVARWRVNFRCLPERECTALLSSKTRKQAARPWSTWKWSSMMGESAEVGANLVGARETETRADRGASSFAAASQLPTTYLTWVHCTR